MPTVEDVAKRMPRVSIKRVVFLTLFFLFLLSFGIFFTYDNVIVLSVMLSSFGLVATFFFVLIIYLRQYPMMYDELTNFLSLHPDEGIASYKPDFYQIHVQDIHKSDLVGLGGLRDKKAS